VRHPGEPGAGRNGQSGEGEPRAGEDQRLSVVVRRQRPLGRVSLPTTPTDLSRLGLAYNEAAVATCDAALAAVGGRDSPAADDERSVPSLRNEAEARGLLGVSLHEQGEQQRGSELLRQAVAMMRQGIWTAAPGFHALEAKRALAALLCNLGTALARPGVQDSNASGSDGMAESAACLREALKLSEETDDIALKQHMLFILANMSGGPDQPVGPAEAAALRSRLNALYAQAGRSIDTSCTICLEPLEQPDGGADQDAADVGGREATNSGVLALHCGHQFHRGCLFTWWCTRPDGKCPLCKK